MESHKRNPPGVCFVLEYTTLPNEWPSFPNKMDYFLNSAFGIATLLSLLLEGSLKVSLKAAWNQFPTNYIYPKHFSVLNTSIPGGVSGCTRAKDL